MFYFTPSRQNIVHKLNKVPLQQFYDWIILHFNSPCRRVMAYIFHWQSRLNKDYDICALMCTVHCSSQISRCHPLIVWRSCVILPYLVISSVSCKRFFENFLGCNVSWSFAVLWMHWCWKRSLFGSCRLFWLRTTKSRIWPGLIVCLYW